MDGKQKIYRSADKNILVQGAMMIDTRKKYRTRKGPVKELICIDEMHFVGRIITGVGDDGSPVIEDVYYTPNGNAIENDREYDLEEIYGYRDDELTKLCDSGIQFRDQVRWFAVQMEKKLKKNDYKGGWEGYSPQWLFEMLLKEMGELYNSLLKYDNREEYTKIVMETCDCANFLMFMADVIHNKYSKE